MGMRRVTLAKQKKKPGHIFSRSKICYIHPVNLYLCPSTKSPGVSPGKHCIVNCSNQLFYRDRKIINLKPIKYK